MRAPLNYIIYAPSYDENKGGVIALHKLCDRINRQGNQAHLWPMPLALSRFEKFQDFLSLRKFATSPQLITPIATTDQMEPNSIVVYPEITSGNPLGAKNIVRWLLFKPGFFTGSANFGKDDMYFKFDDFCEAESVTDGTAQSLFTFTVNPCYFNPGETKRSGSCYMMRKGKGRTLEHDDDSSILLDNISHKKTAEIFRRTKTFYCYDEATMYSQFAAISGCVSIVMPQSYRSRADWVAAHPLSKYGIAYGIDDTAHAVSTMHRVSDYLKTLEVKSEATIVNFVKSTQEHFGQLPVASEREPSD